MNLTFPVLFLSESLASVCALICGVHPLSESLASVCALICGVHPKFGLIRGNSVHVETNQIFTKKPGIQAYPYSGSDLAADHIGLGLL
jgi:hypothetical protein